MGCYIITKKKYATICMNLTNMKLSKEAGCKKCL